ncbi:PAS domain S-box protein [Ancylothrix sp. C2]|uniref:PAS domain S-box protein n=1 Tax=Ancylothrix sp. D3o TaxID=2953691 RepID=UPI0021BB6A4B|nr:PAS domain S-box protein [Ancylothrix sp. D3o]MCT7951857.1 PAS domain S-box protein [Ancylothrix sp. D3o]
MQSAATLTQLTTDVKILLIEDNAQDAELIKELLQEIPHPNKIALTWVQRLGEAIAVLQKENFNLILLDLSLPDSFGFDTLVRLQEFISNSPIVVLGNNSNEELALQSIQVGAQDYLIKGKIDSSLLNRSLNYAIERHRLAKSLQENHEKNRSFGRFFTLSLDLLCIAGIDGYFKHLNPAWLETLGYTEAELIGKPFLDFIHPDDLQDTLKEVAKLNTGLLSLSFENRYLCKDGSYKWLSWRSVAFVEEQLIYAVARDITSRKQAEEELNKFKLVVENTSDAVAMSDFNGHNYYQNQAFNKLYEYETTEEFNAAGGMQIAFTQPEIAQEILTTIQKGKSWEGEVEQISRTGRKIATLIRANAMKDELGNLIGLVAITTDITQRKAAEESALKLAEQLQEAQKVAHIGVWDFDIQTGHINWSDELFEIYERPHGVIPSFEEIVEQIYPEDRDKFINSVQNAINFGAPYDDDLRIVLSSGGIKDIHSKGQAIKNNSGQTIKLFGTAMDITARKGVEEALRQQLKRTRIVAEILERIRSSLHLEEVLTKAVKEVRQFLLTDRTVIYRFQPDWSGTVIVESVSEDFMPIQGRDIQDNCFINTYIPLYQKGRQRAVEDVENSNLNPCHIKLLQSLQIKANLVIPILEGNNLWGLLIAHHCRSERPWQSFEIECLKEISVQLAIAIQQSTLFEQAQNELIERKLAELALRESETRERLKAEELEITLNKLKNAQSQLVQQEKMAGLGQLVAGVAHEINNPVNFIYGNILPATSYTEDLLRIIGLYQKHFPTPPEEISEEMAAVDFEFIKDDFMELLRSMQEGANRIKEIVLSLRNFSRLDEAEMKEADIHSGIDSTLMILQHRLKEQQNRKAIPIIKNYANLPLIQCYPGQLNQVFMNIVSNAIDALEEKIKLSSNFLPTLQITTEVKLPLNSENPSTPPSAVIHIADNGGGMSDELKERIFNPFFTTKPVGAGTGLGLSISYQIIVEKHHGVLTCNSVLGKGTEFIIEIPINPIPITPTPCQPH